LKRKSIEIFPYVGMRIYFSHVYITKYTQLQLLFRDIHIIKDAAFHPHPLRSGLSQQSRVKS